MGCPHYDVSQGAQGWVCQDCGAGFKVDPWDRYYTSPETAALMVKVARLEKGSSVLEPSAGDGAILRALPIGDLSPTAVEINAENARWIRGIRAGIEVFEEDFLRWKPPTVYDVAIMNPPYSSQAGADGLHVAQALRCCRRVVALVRTNFLHGFQRYHQVFRWARLLSVTILVRRPTFTGPANKGDTARHDYQILELEPLGGERTAARADEVKVRFVP